LHPLFLAYSGVFVRWTSGDWTIRNPRFVDVGGDGADVRKSSGDWTVAAVVVVDPARTASTPPGQLVTGRSRTRRSAEAILAS
jgi:hypothetical protein